MLKLEKINVYYGNIHAVKDISFHVEQGEIVTLIGANGAGKTTTLSTICGLMHCRSGKIEFLGEDITHTPGHKLIKKGLSLVPEGRRVHGSAPWTGAVAGQVPRLRLGGGARP